MSMKRGIFALGVAAMLAFATFAFGDSSTANACCAGDPTLSTENSMTILPAGSPVTVPGGSVTYNINVSAANVIYKGFQWEVAGDDTIVNFVSFTHPNQASTLLTTCSAPANSFPFGAGAIEIYGGGSGCISLGPEAGTTFVGTVATVTVQCKIPGITGIALLGFDSDPNFGTTTSDATGATIPTELYPQQPNPNYPAFGPPTLAIAPFLCLNPVDLSIVKTAPATAPANTTGTYTLTVTNPTTGPELGTVTDVMPAGVTATGVLPAPCVITGGGTGISCPNLPLPPGDTVVAVAVSFNTCGSKANTATVALNAGIVIIGGSPVPTRTDPNPLNNTSSAVTNVDCANLTVTKTGPIKATSGDAIVYNIQICNDGGGTAATNVVVSDNPGPTPVPASYASIASSSCVNSTVTTVAGAAGVQCNTASASQDASKGPVSNQSEACTVINANFPEFNGLRKDCEPFDFKTGEPEPATDTTCNLWLSQDAFKLPVGSILIAEQLNLQPDIDTCNDDDDGDGFPCAGDPTKVLFDFQVPQDNCALANSTKDSIFYTTENYIPHQTSVDCDGGELPEGLGALEVQIKYDHKLFQQPIFDCGDFFGDRPVVQQVTIITENWSLFGCVTKSAVLTVGQSPETGAQCTGAGAGVDDDGDGVADDGCPTQGIVDPAQNIAFITLTVQDDLFQRIRPTKNNGVVTTLLDENCEAADIFGMPWPGHLQGGLLPECGDVTITIRMLEGDVNLDCAVDIADDQAIAFRYGSFFGNLLYNKFFDLEPNIAPDFDIDIKDLQTVFGRNGSTCDHPIPDQDPNGQTPAPPDVP